MKALDRTSTLFLLCCSSISKLGIPALGLVFHRNQDTVLRMSEAELTDRLVDLAIKAAPTFECGHIVAQ
jgi:hypothetical protein